MDPGTAASGASAAASLARFESLLLSGSRDEALAFALDRGLHAHAMLLARRAGDAAFASAAARFVRASCREGSPLRALELLLAGAPARDVVSGGFGEKGVASFEHSAQQRGPAGTVVETHHHHHPGGGVSGGGGVEGVLAMLPRWREHVAALASNPAEGTGEVLVALGDALWRERGAAAKAHVAYVLAGAAPQPFHPRARGASSARTTGGSRGRSTPTRTPSGARNSWSTRAAS